MKALSNEPLFFRSLNIHDILLYSLVLLVAFLLKWHYSVAGSDALRWILLPTATLAEYLTGFHFTYEYGVGYISTAAHLIIAPACAGVNFLIITFCMITFSQLHRFKTPIPKYRCVMLYLGAAYLYTIAINAIRIVTGIYLNRSTYLDTWFTPKQAHKIEGVVIFFTALLVFNFCINKATSFIMHRYRIHGSNKILRHPYRSAVVVGLNCFFWYIIIMLIVPIVTHYHAIESSTLFNHAMMVIVLPLFLTVGILLLPLMILVGRINKRSSHDCTS